jgi:GlpG protein
MRQIATLPQEPARRFCDYLTTLQIDTRQEPETAGVAVWVCDEDRVEQARQELEQFLRHPADPRYGRAAAAARALRRQHEEEEEDYRHLQEQAEEQLEEGSEPGPRPVTFGLMAASVLAALATRFGSLTDSLTRALLISTQPPDGFSGLHEVVSGEVWRLVTPIFLHFDLVHLLFNLFMFLPLAGQIESLRGSRRVVLLIVVLAVVSNLVQYFLGATTFDGLKPTIAGSWNFGGLSGVIYGLLGYVWMKSRLEPDSGFEISAHTVVLLLAWLFIGPLVVKNIANGAHVGGLIAGVLLGAMPSFWARKGPTTEDTQEPE